MNILPALDIRDGQCVRLLYGDYDAETRYDVDPVAQARHYAAFGVGQLHLVDLDGAKAGKPVNVALLAAMTEASGVSVQVGGGIRERAHLDTLFANGVARAVIGSMAIRQPDTVAEWLTVYGSERIVLALDVRIDDAGVPRVCTDAWTTTSEASLSDTISRFREHGLRHVLCTDIGRDGAMSGPSIALYRQVLQEFPELQLQASGGVAGIDDLRALRDAGLPAAITGKALLEGAISAEEIRECLRGD